MKTFKWIKRCSMILMLYGVGLAEAHYLPRYGIEWLLMAIAVTAFLAGFWIRAHWDA
jgi:hypothetical protein